MKQPPALLSATSDGIITFLIAGIEYTYQADAGLFHQPTHNMWAFFNNIKKNGELISQRERRSAGK